MFNLVLYQPEIPPNTGNIIRLCANTGCQLHLIQPLGFSLDHRQLKRAGLDYHEFAHIQVYPNLDDLLAQFNGYHLYAFTTKGSTRYDRVAYQPGDILLFGPETRGLPDSILDSLAPEHKIRIPMRPNQRSLNLANAAAIAVYEAWRQCGFIDSPLKMG